MMKPSPRAVLLASVAPLGLLLCAGVGIYLRLFLLTEQILLDDEWHSLHFALRHPYGYLATHFSVPGATSIPLNLYAKLLLETVGWSELGLRMPSVASGIVSLVVLPPLVWRIFGSWSAVVFSVMFACSPLVIFYSRSARPYGAVVFLCGLAMLAGWEWTRTGRRSWALVWGSSAVGAIWLHVFAAVGVLSPVLGYLILVPLRGKAIAPRAGITPRAMIPAVVAVMLLAALLTLPAVYFAMQGSLMAAAGHEGLSPKVLAGFFEMLTGTAEHGLQWVLGLLMIAGVARLARRDPVAVAGMSIAILGYGLLFSLTRPVDIQSPLVVARYAVALFPMAFVLMGAGASCLVSLIPPGAETAKNLISGGAVLLLGGALFMKGPLPRTYAGPNNFTNHAAYQETYAPPAADQSYISRLSFTDAGYGAADIVMKDREVPSTYRQIAADPASGGVVEYPMLIGDHLNVYYYYQRQHRRGVRIGYLPMRWAPAPPGEDYLFDTSLPDEVLGMVGDPSHLRFASMVDIRDSNALRKAGGFLVVHLDPLEEINPRLTRGPESLPNTAAIQAWCTAMFGPPAYQDRGVAAYRLRNEGHE